MTNKNLSRRDAIKLISAATSASMLANLPAKWSKPELAGSIIPAHAQTSGCAPGTLSLLIEFLTVSGSGWDYYYYGPNPRATFDINNHQLPHDNESVLFPCTSACIYWGINSAVEDISVRFTVPDYNNFTDTRNISAGQSVYISVNGATPEVSINNGLASGCPSL